MWVCRGVYIYICRGLCVGVRCGVCVCKKGCGGVRTCGSGVNVCRGVGVCVWCVCICMNVLMF